MQACRHGPNKGSRGQQLHSLRKEGGFERGLYKAELKLLDKQLVDEQAKHVEQMAQAASGLEDIRSNFHAKEQESKQKLEAALSSGEQQRARLDELQRSVETGRLELQEALARAQQQEQKLGEAETCHRHELEEKQQARGRILRPLSRGPSPERARPRAVYGIRKLA